MLGFSRAFFIEFSCSVLQINYHQAQWPEISFNIPVFP